MIKTIIEAIAIAYEMIDGLIEAAKEAGADEEDLKDSIQVARVKRRARLEADREAERNILP